MPRLRHFSETSHRMSKKQHPLVSVVVPTLNSAKTIGKCLRSIEDQSYDNLEIIIVDRYSKDATLEIARRYNVTVFQRGPERSAQKNWGAQHAKAELLYFVDSDFILDHEIVQACVEACERFSAVTTINYSTGRSVWAKSIALKERFLAHDPSIQTVKFIKARTFFEIGGFDEKLTIGEDLDLYARLVECGHTIGNVTAIEWHIGEPETLRQIISRSYYYGKNVRTYFAKRKNYAIRQLSPFKIGLVLTVLRTGDPHIPSLFIVDLTRWISSLVGVLSSITTGRPTDSPS